MGGRVQVPGGGGGGPGRISSERPSTPTGRAAVPTAGPASRIRRSFPPTADATGSAGHGDGSAQLVAATTTLDSTPSIVA